MRWLPHCLVLLLALSAPACSSVDADRLPTDAGPRLSTTMSTDSFRVWGATTTSDGMLETTGDSYTLHSWEWINMGTDSLKREHNETTRTFSGGDVYNGGWIEVSLHANGETKHLPNIDADLHQDEVFHLPGGGSATLAAYPDEPSGCTFVHWRVDGVYYTDPTITHTAGDGNYDHMAVFQCPG